MFDYMSEEVVVYYKLGQNVWLHVWRGCCVLQNRAKCLTTCLKRLWCITKQDKMFDYMSEEVVVYHKTGQNVWLHVWRGCCVLQNRAKCLTTCLKRLWCITKQGKMFDYMSEEVVVYHKTGQNVWLHVWRGCCVLQNRAKCLTTCLKRLLCITKQGKMFDYMSEEVVVYYKTGQNVWLDVWRGCCVLQNRAKCLTTYISEEVVVYYKTGQNVWLHVWRGCGVLQNRTKWAASWQNQQNDCAPSKVSDQPGHPPSLIRVFAVRSMGS